MALLLGCSPGVSAAPDICVFAPHLALASSLSPTEPRAVVPISRPTLFIREPLAELRIEEGSHVLWSWASQMGEALEGPVAWPLPPLKAGQTLTIRLRPIGARPDASATIELVGAPAQRLHAGDRLFQSLLGTPKAWRPTIEALLAKGDHPLATALLFANEGPNDPDLNDLRRLAVQNSCP